METMIAMIYGLAWIWAIVSTFGFLVCAGNVWECQNPNKYLMTPEAKRLNSLREYQSITRGRKWFVAATVCWVVVVVLWRM